MLGQQGEGGGHQQTEKTDPEGQQHRWSEAGLSDHRVGEKHPVQNAGCLSQ